MDATDIKVYGVNFLSIVLTFSDLMDVLKFVALKDASIRETNDHPIRCW